MSSLFTPPSQSPSLPSTSPDNIIMSHETTNDDTACRYSPDLLYADLASLPSEQQATSRAARLAFLLEKSTIYAKIIGDRMARQQIEKQRAEHRAQVRKENKDKKVEVQHREGLRDHKADMENGDASGSANGANNVVKGKRKRQSDAGAKDKRPKTEGAEVSCCYHSERMYTDTCSRTRTFICQRNNLRWRRPH